MLLIDTSKFGELPDIFILGEDTIPEHIVEDTTCIWVNGEELLFACKVIGVALPLVELGMVPFRGAAKNILREFNKECK